MTNRRTLLKNTAAIAGLGMLHPRHLSAQTEQDVHIGDNAEAFEALFGTGRDENGYLGYEGHSDDTADYWVLFNYQGGAEPIEIDFQHLPEGGSPSSKENIATSRFIRDDATPIGPTMLLGSLNNWRHSFHISPWKSDRLVSVLIVPASPS